MTDTDIDKGLETIVHKMDQMDGTVGHSAKSRFFSVGAFSGGASSWSGFVKDYFFHWTLFILISIIILVIRPTYVFVPDPVTRRTRFRFYSFCVLSCGMYVSVLLLFYIHTRWLSK